MTHPGMSSSADPIDEIERRWGERLAHAARVMVVRGESAWYTQLLDFSEGGCGLFRPADCTLEPDDVVRLFFYSDTHPVVIVTARVARVTETQLGIEYHEPQSIPPAPADP